jgi:hypothetical protein
MKLGHYIISNTAGNKQYPTCAVRVYKCTPGASKKLIAEVFPLSRNPLGYLRKHPGSLFTLSLITQLRLNKMSENDIATVLRPVGGI